MHFPALLVSKHDARTRGTEVLQSLQSQFASWSSSVCTPGAIAIFNNKKLQIEIFGWKTAAIVAEIKRNFKSALTSCFFFSRIIVKSGSEA